MKIKQIFQIGQLSLLIFLFCFSAKVSAAWSFNVGANDTIAGYSAFFKTSQIEANTEVEFLVTKPNGAELKLRAKTNLGGVAETELYGYNTKQAGLYKVAAKRITDKNFGTQKAFRVYADTISSTQSLLKTDKDTASAGGEKVYLSIVLYDRYRNPIPDHQVRLISSRPEDTLKLSSGYLSDSNGVIVYTLSSNYPGVSIYSAVDVNTGITLDERIKIIYYTPVEKETPRGGNYLQADIFSADSTLTSTSGTKSGPIHHFDLEIPTEIPINVAQTITVTAKDKDNNVAKDYVGTILFATPNDENAILPANDGKFTFSDKDQGRFTFNLAIKFSKLGVQTIQVMDEEDWDILGEKKVTVVDQSGWQTPLPVGSLEIKTPADGTTLSASTIILTGKGNPRDQLKIYDNDLKIGEAEVDGDGAFSFTALNLTNGLHSFYINGEKDVSNTVNLTIDISPPVIDSFSITPAGEIDAGSSFSVKVVSEPFLSSVQVRINSVPESLFESSQSSGNYETTLMASAIPGEYPIDVILIDSLGNKGEYLNKGVLRIKKGTLVWPPRVTGLKASAEEEKVNLNWDEVKDSETPLAKYRIYFGENENYLNQTAETNGLLNHWYIPNLENGKKYYFALTAVDIQGQESLEKSLIVNAIPQELQSMLRVVPSDSRVTLSWDNFGINPVRYKINYGVESGVYLENVITFDNRTTWYIPDLINGVKYYFQVVPLDALGKEQAPSPEASAAPTGAGFHPVAGSQNYILPQNYAPQGDTGPESWIVILASLFVVDIVLRIRKRFI